MQRILVTAVTCGALLLGGCGDPPACPSTDTCPDATRSDCSLPDLRVDLPLLDIAVPDQLPPVPTLYCNTAPPPGATLAPDPPPYSGGTCPTLYHGFNSFTDGSGRTFYLVLPASPLPGERFPLLFMWHWLMGDIQRFLQLGELQRAADEQRFIAVLPQSKEDIEILGLFDLPWPFTSFESDERLAEELTFFDDMLACISAQFPVNKECVSSAGMSAGALFTSQLVGARSQYLASFISLSGGVGGGSGVNYFLREWTPPEHILPALVLWGGADDTCITVSFERSSHKQEDELVAGGHFFVECIHNCGHAEPPAAPVAEHSLYAGLWRFVFDHPYWLADGDSPYLQQGLPASAFSWCGIGQDSANPRTGACGEPACPF